MTQYTDRMRQHQGVEVTHEQAAAVLADIALHMERAAIVANHHAVLRGLAGPRDLEAFRLGFSTALDLVREGVLAHRNPDTYQPPQRPNGGTT